MIPRQDGYLKLGEEKQRIQIRLHQGLRRELYKRLQAGSALCTRLVPSPLAGRSWRQNRSSTFAKRVPGRLFRPGSPCCVPRKEPRSCWQHLWVLLVQGNIRRDFLIQSWREGEDFPRDPRLLGNAQQPLGLLRATMDQAGLLHQHSEEQHEYFRWAGANKSKWIEGLYPRTINKVHQN